MTMFDKLAEVEKRFEEINQRLYDPDIVSDVDRYKELMKETKNLTPIVEKYREYPFWNYTGMIIFTVTN